MSNRRVLGLKALRLKARWLKQIYVVTNQLSQEGSVTLDLSD